MITMTEKSHASAVLHDDAQGPILVATDGTESAEPALRATLELAPHFRNGVVALAVMEGLPLVAADYGILLPSLDDPAARRNALLNRVRAQLRALSADDWTVEIREGEPPVAIADAARDLNAAMIVVGLGHHELLDRLFGGETALHTLRLSRVPVLAVPVAQALPPKRVVVATDFTVASVNAARKALELFDTIGQVHLLHVSPPLELQPDAFASWMSVFGEGVDPAFERVKAEIGLPENVTVETAVKAGKPSKEVLDFARSVNADLIVTGSRGAGLVNRILVGSTATGIIRGAQCAVLAVPSVRGEQRLTWPDTGERVTLDRSQWARDLEMFTKRNVGRLASLEVDDPELGAQAQEHDYPLLGVSWDHHDERVDIMVGDFEGVRRHLTRSIAGVTQIDVLKDEAGRDWILRMAHGRGQTLLSLKR